MCVAQKGYVIQLLGDDFLTGNVCTNRTPDAIMADALSKGNTILVCSNTREIYYNELCFVLGLKLNITLSLFIAVR